MSESIGYLKGEAAVHLDNARKYNDEYQRQLRKVAEAQAECDAAHYAYKETVRRNKITRAEDEKTRNKLITVILGVTFGLIVLVQIAFHH